MKIIVILLVLIKSICAYRILGIFPHPGLSHFHFFHPIMRSLAEAGHEVTVVSHFPNQPPMENYKDELLSEVNDGLVNAVSLDVSSNVKINSSNLFNNLNSAICEGKCLRSSSGIFYAANLGTRCL
jgi:hypothetical protein